MGQVLAFDEGDQPKCNGCVCIVMECGAISMDKYLLKHRQCSQHAQLAMAEKFLAIIAAAHSVGVVLMDFKFSNIVMFVTKEGDVNVKAIDFGNSCSENDMDVISGDVTPAYSCPEIAKYILAQTASSFLLSDESAMLPRKPNASHKMDIMALGWAVFELCNDSVSYWKSLSPPLEEDGDILKALVELTDKDVEHNIHVSFPGEKNFPLRSWLTHALKVNPKERASSIELQAHSLFGSKDRTQDIASFASKIDSLRSDVRKVALTLEEMNAKLDVISDIQNDLGHMVRQLVIHGGQDHEEIKKCLSDVHNAVNMNAIQQNGASAEKFSLDEMKTMIESSVSNSLNALQDNSNISEDIKVLLVDTLKHCNETSHGACDFTQLNQIMSSLDHLQSDLALVISEVGEMRGDIAQVNTSLGCHLNMLSSLVNPKHNSPVMLIVIPTKSSMLNNFKGIFRKEMIISFVCPVTKLPVKSGQDGKGYRLKLPTTLVKRVAPMIAITFAIVEVALLVYGIPLPTPPLPRNMKSREMVGLMLNEMSTVVVTETDNAAAEADAVGEEEDHAEVLEHTKEVIESCHLEDGESLSKSNRKKMDRTVGKASDAAYSAVRDMLMDLEGCDSKDNANWRPKYTGLVQVTSKADGSTAWVSEEAREIFEAKGMSSISS